MNKILGITGVIGVILIFCGFFSLALPLIDWFVDYTQRWPFVVIVAGVVLFTVAVIFLSPNEDADVQDQSDVAESIKSINDQSRWL